ncbi:hypothetical protein GEMRC1_002570 [Eukaryota sp. GEM-RC1]
MTSLSATNPMHKNRDDIIPVYESGVKTLRFYWNSFLDLSIIKLVAGTIAFFIGVLLGTLLIGWIFPDPSDCDLLIKFGTVYDGTLTTIPTTQHVCIKGSRISQLLPVDTDLSDLDIDETIDAAGYVVTPGFIDAHLEFEEEMSHMFALRDGVTTRLYGQDGFSPDYPEEGHPDYTTEKDYIGYIDKAEKVLIWDFLLDTLLSVVEYWMIQIPTQINS